MPPPQAQRQQAQRHQLRGKRLGGSDADFPSGAGEQGQRRLAHQRAFRDVADCQCGQITALFGRPQRRQGVGGFAGLGDADEQRPRRRHSAPVAVFAGHLDRARNAELLQPVAGDHSGVIAGAARDDVNAPGLVQHRPGFRPKALVQQPALMDAPGQSFGDHGRLLKDFLEHEMAVAALAHCAALLRRVGQRALDDSAGAVVDREALALHLGDVAFFKENEGLRDRSQGEHVRSDEMLFNADAQHQRTAGARRDQAFRVFAANHPQAVSAGELSGRLLHRAQQAAGLAHSLIDQMRDHLGVGVGFKMVTGGNQRLFQFPVILDDAVMHHRYRLIADMRVGVALAGFAVGSPTGMGDAQWAAHRFLVQALGEHLHLADGA